VNLETTRNFYGVLRVNYHENEVPEGLPVEYDNVDRNGPKRELIHGRIQHGFQYLDPEKRDWPTSYYGHPSGIGIAIDQHPRRIGAGNKNLRIGVIGLGCGTLAAYGTPGDVIRYYEINSAVIRISEEFFFYRQNSAAEVQVVLGDARIQMEQELAANQPQQFDVLAVDAFSSDSIPMHLLTAECVEIYRRHLKPDGLLCLHISNRYLNLNGVARGAALVLGWEAVRINSDGDNSLGLDAATWVIVTGNRAFLDAPEVRLAVEPWNEKDRPPLVWTDDYGSLWQTLGK
jgi:SAM-dependent methyltransferase